MRLAVLASFGCTFVGPELGREVERIRSAVIPGEVKESVTAGEPERGLWSRTWTWQFRTTRPAARYREAVVRSLEPTYKCETQRRRVRCSRALRGDRVQLDIAAHPAEGGTLVKAQLRTAAY